MINGSVEKMEQKSQQYKSGYTCRPFEWRYFCTSEKFLIQLGEYVVAEDRWDVDVDMEEGYGPGS